MSVYSLAKAILSVELPINFKISYEKNTPKKVKTIDNRTEYISVW